MAEIVNADKNAAILKAMTSAGISHYLWFGLTDMDSEGTWVSASAGLAATFTDWDVGQPDNNVGNQDCALFWNKYGEWKWDDDQCTDSFNFLCEKP